MKASVGQSTAVNKASYCVHAALQVPSRRQRCCENAMPALLPIAGGSYAHQRHNVQAVSNAATFTSIPADLPFIPSSTRSRRSRSYQGPPVPEPPTPSSGTNATRMSSKQDTRNTKSKQGLATVGTGGRPTREASPPSSSSTNAVLNIEPVSNAEAPPAPAPAGSTSSATASSQSAPGALIQLLDRDGTASIAASSTDTNRACGSSHGTTSAASAVASTLNVNSSALGPNGAAGTSNVPQAVGLGPGAGAGPGAAPAPSPASGEGAGAAGVAGDRQLYEELKSCSSWEEVLELVEDEAGYMSMFTAVQAAGRLVALLRSLGPSRKPVALQAMSALPAFRTLRGVLLEGVPTMTRAQLCNSLHALGQLQVKLGPGAVQAYATRTQELAPELNARDISQLLHGYSTLGVTPGVPVLDMVGFRATHLLTLGDFEPQGISMLLTACAELRYSNHQLMTSSAQALLGRLPDFTPQGVSQSLRAYAKLGCLSHRVLTACLDQFQRTAAQYQAQELCGVLWSLAQARYQSPEVMSLAVRTLADRAPSLLPADFATIFYTLGTFGVHPGPRLMGLLTPPLTRLLPRCKPAELCNLYWGLGLIGEGSHQLAASIAALLPDCYAMDQLPDSLLRQVFQGFLCAKMSAAAAQEQAATSGSKADAKAAAEQPGADVKFPPLMVAAMKRSWLAGLQSSPAPAQALAVQQGHVSTQPPSPQAATSRGQEEGESDGEEEEGVEQEEEEGEEEGASAEVDDMSFKARVARQRTRQFRAPTTRSEVASILEQLKVEFQAGQSTQDGLAVVHFALEPQPGRQVALQVLFEYQHTSNTGQLLGPAQFETRVLEMNGWELLQRAQGALLLSSRGVREARDCAAVVRAREPGASRIRAADFAASSQVRHIRAKDLKSLEARSLPLFVGDILRTIGCRVPAFASTDVLRGAHSVGRWSGQQGGRGVRPRGEDANGLDLLMEQEPGKRPVASGNRATPPRVKGFRVKP
ncbi:hypothetical protein QJQ45_016072 [Haematococcus lacustris]|nr:hypothetical protein QJQ45_016072 [Haematococcus lacustris]